MILPGRNFLLVQILVFFCIVISIPVFIKLEWQSVDLLSLLAVQGALIILFLLDGFTLPSRGSIELKREVPFVLVAGRPYAIRLVFVLRTRFRIRYRVQIHDGISLSMSARDFPLKAHFKRGLNRLEYSLTVARRGQYRLDGLYLTIISWTGFSRRIIRLPCEDMLRVFPSVTTSEESLVAYQRRMSSFSGILKTSVPGGEREFHRLRDYVSGDEFRRIDWKGTARSRKLISREFERDNHQAFLLVIDCGRVMGLSVGDRSYLDEAIESAIFISGIAARQGDEVGLLVWSDEPIVYLPPRRGNDARLPGLLYDIEPANRFTDFEGLSGFIQRVIKRDCCICLYSNFFERRTGEALLGFYKKLSLNHKILMVFLENEGLLHYLSQSARKEIHEIPRRADLFRSLSAGQFHLIIKNGNPGSSTYQETFLEHVVDESGMNEVQALVALEMLLEKHRIFSYFKDRRTGLIYSRVENLRPAMMSEYFRLRNMV